jgi:molecular chaperone DnaK
VKRAVITVPAYFNDNQRQATKDAATIAGLEVIRMINEPTAAAVAYGFNKAKDSTIAVYDLGGGTFDVSVVRVGANARFEVIASSGDTYLGGEDFDERIMNSLIEQFLGEQEIDLRDDRAAMQRLKDAAETLKCALSEMETTEVNLPFIAQKNGQAVHLKRTVTRREIEELCQDLVDRTIQVCTNVLAAAKLSPRDLSEMVLVGGMSRMPVVRQAVREFFGCEPSKGINPDEAVAVGAALFAYGFEAEQSGTGRKPKLLDVTPQTLGIMVKGMKVAKVIPGNTRIPARSTERFPTSHDGQKAIDIVIVQGEHENANDNAVLGRFRMSGLRPAPRGEIGVDVTFAIDEDGVVHVTAKNSETGAQQSIEISASTMLSRAEVKKLTAANTTRRGRRG